MTCLLTDFEIALPATPVDQLDGRAWTLNKHLESARLRPHDGDTTANLTKLFARYSVKPELISRRHFEFPDIATEPHARIYPIDGDHPAGSPIDERARFFTERALERLAEFYPAEAEEPSHLVHVTCTGYRSPSAAQLMMAKKGWRNVGLTHAYHMGCYAALPAIRLGSALAAHARARVDVVHNEMCSLHMNPAAHSPEQIVVQSLFADGHAKYSIKTEGADARGLAILAIKERVIPDSDADMSWIPEPWGMQMNLSREVPRKIGEVIEPFFFQLVREAGRDPEALLRDAVFAIHPGGPKIIDAVATQLGLGAEQIADSKQVLFERGNMSSATLPHVWRRILAAGHGRGTAVVSFAFGPGLTVFGAVFEVR